jgi:hypothetical protein
LCEQSVAIVEQLAFHRHESDPDWECARLFYRKTVKRKT